jgi:lon-related putative ATP-dependent protease
MANQKNRAGNVVPLTAEKLFTRCEPDQFRFDTTAELDGPEQVIGQDRAMEAIHFGIGIRRDGYNLFLLGPTGMGKHTMVRRFIEQRAKSEPTPDDYCYVNNFDQPHNPRALKLPAGQGRRLKQDMRQLLDDLRNAIPAAFESDEYRSRAQEIEQSFKERQEKAFQDLQEEAEKEHVALVHTPSGFALAPAKDDEVLGPDEFDMLTEEEREHYESVIEALHDKLRSILHNIPRWHKESHNQLKELQHEVTLYAAGHLIDELRAAYADLPQVQEYLQAVQQDVLENASAFRSGEDGGNPLEAAMGRESNFERYEVNLLVEHEADTGAPVIYEDHPVYQNLVGRLEHQAHMGTLVTNFTYIKPGALHRANGGYLILDARKLLLSPFAWEGIKRALQSGRIHIESMEHMYGLASTLTLEPEPIPLEVKVVLVGDRMLYYLLHAYDPEFAKLFKVAADFESEVDRNPDNAQAYARLIAGVAKRDGLLPFNRSAVARVIEQGARLVEDAQKLSTHLGKITDLLAESDYWARDAGHEVITAGDVQRAIDAGIRRADRIRERMQEEVLRGTFLIDCEGEKVGQINGLSVISMAGYSFGQASRITATARLGAGKVVDIQRETDMGGPIHSKGVLILSSLLAARYAPRQPLSLHASLVFEQSYGLVEGDSASMAELCALLSVLADVPIRQSLAMTGSVDQHGKSQPIGSVNEKIEGFFDLCKAHGLNGEQGVVIPANNVKHLMLRKDVVDAVRERRFHIYPIHNLDEALEVMTGLDAGQPGEDGRFPPDSVNGRVQARLEEFASLRRHFGTDGQSGGKSTNPPVAEQNND